PSGKLADAEVIFGADAGPLSGLKLIGFAIWERRAGGRNVTFPARQYSVNGERRTFALLRPANGDASIQEGIRAYILEAYDGPGADVGGTRVAPGRWFSAPPPASHGCPPSRRSAPRGRSLRFHQPRVEEDRHGHRPSSRASPRDHRITKRGNDGCAGAD